MAGATTKGNLLVLVGPTAVGKTAYSIGLAKALGAEIISGDSMQVYRGMDIGTAKITPEEMQGVPHHLLDICDPGEAYNAARFKGQAEKTIQDIHNRQRLPMVVGGTGLYINGLMYDFDYRETRRNLPLREKLEERIATEGGEVLLRELAALDPETAAQLYPADSQRIVRALEVVLETGRPLDRTRDRLRAYQSPYRLCLIGLTMDRADMYERINRRVDQMLTAGLVEEVRGLLDAGVPRDALSMQGIGYKEIAAHLDGDITLEEAAELVRLHSRRFAKRQLTWFRRDPNIRWFEVDGASQEENTRNMLQYVNSILQEPCK